MTFRHRKNVRYSLFHAVQIISIFLKGSNPEKHLEFTGVENQMNIIFRFINGRETSKDMKKHRKKE